MDECNKILPIYGRRWLAIANHFAEFKSEEDKRLARENLGLEDVTDRINRLSNNVAELKEQVLNLPDYSNLIEIVNQLQNNINDLQIQINNIHLPNLDDYINKKEFIILEEVIANSLNDLNSRLTILENN